LPIRFIAVIDNDNNNDNNIDNNIDSDNDNDNENDKKYTGTITKECVGTIAKKCVGTIAIVQNDLKCRDYTPWLASLYVDKPFRNNKIGEQLIDKIKNVAAEGLGYSELYLRTEHAGDYYRRLGWQFVESCVDEYGVNTDVFRIMVTVHRSP
jgi:N-acetylglutamate synthase-like GNAT family acetyltransferase